MKVELLPEPTLEFGYGGTHIDIRAGLTRYGPFDQPQAAAPKQIRLGLVGTAQSVDGVAGWLERCREGVFAKQSRQPNLFPAFPGCGPEMGLRASLILSSDLRREIPQRYITDLIQACDRSELIARAAELFINEFAYLVEYANVDVLVCAWPMDLLDAIEPDDPTADSDEEERGSHQAGHRLDFHDFLKARAMGLKKPVQVIRPTTYDEQLRRRQKRSPDKVRQIQDPATCAWNIHTALYYKAGGTPWRLIRDPSEYAACYVGVSFYQTLDGSELQTSVAQVFNQRGEGIVLRGGKAKISQHDRQPHLAQEDARRLLTDTLEKYRQTHRHLPARIVLHKTSPFNQAELDGFATAADENRIDLLDLVSIRKSNTRLFRSAVYPTLRGTLLSLEQDVQILYTRGSVEFFATWPGLYVPMPRRLTYASASQSPRFLAQEALALTKMNWNNTQFDGGDPITIRAARQVSSMLRYISDDEPIEPRYSYYM